MVNSLSRAAIFWASFYHLTLRYDTTAMKRAGLMKYLGRVSELYGLRISYFSSSRKIKTGLKVNHF
jgi:hypothetical protein